MTKAVPPLAKLITFEYYVGNNSVFYSSTVLDQVFFLFLTAVAFISLHFGSGSPWQQTVQQSHGTSGRAPKQSDTKCSSFNLQISRGILPTSSLSFMWNSSVVQKIDKKLLEKIWKNLRMSQRKQNVLKFFKSPITVGIAPVKLLA